MQTIPFLLVLVIVPVCFTLIIEDEIYLTIQVPFGKEECFFVPILKPEYRSMEFSYTVARGNRDISLTVRDPRGVEVVTDERKKYNFHRIVVGTSPSSLGDYTLCMDNTYGYESKAVSLSLHLLGENGEYVRNKTQLKHSDQLVSFFESSTHRLMNNIDAADRLLVQVRVISNIDRSIAEQNFDRVNWYGTVNTCIILLAALTQVLLVRSLFVDESRVGKLLRRGRM